MSNEPDNWRLIQIAKLTGENVPRPYRLIETYMTSEGPRTRVCSGNFATLEDAGQMKAQLEANADGAGNGMDEQFLPYAGADFF